MSKIYWPVSHGPNDDWPVSRPEGQQAPRKRKSSSRASITCARCSARTHTTLAKSSPLFGYCSKCTTGAQRANPGNIEGQVNWLANNVYKGRGDGRGMSTRSKGKR